MKEPTKIMLKPTKEEQRKGIKTYREQHYCAECGKKTSLWICEQHKSGYTECEPDDLEPAHQIPLIIDDEDDPPLVTLSFLNENIEFDNELSNKILEQTGLKKAIKDSYRKSLSGDFEAPEFDSEECIVKFLKKKLK